MRTGRKLRRGKSIKQDKPSGDLNLIFKGGWCHGAPNGIIEDGSGQLWLAFLEWSVRPGMNRPIPGTEFKRLDSVAALAWIENASQFLDGYECDVADICRIALGDLRRLASTGKPQLRKAALREPQNFPGRGN